MMRRRKILVALVLLLCGGLLYAFKLWRDNGSLHSPGDYSMSGESIDLYTVAQPGERLRLYWRNAQGDPFESMEPLRAAVEAEGKRLLFATNSGIYMDTPQGPRPLGLHIEAAQELVPLNTQPEGYGNFYLQPNGVFWWTEDGEAHVTPTGTYAVGGFAPTYALQSGPMLVMEGELNPAFKLDSPNRDLRAGVGVDADGVVYIGVSSRPVTLHEFATAFKRIECVNALYLDGGIISRFSEEPSLQKTGGKLAGILAVVE